MHYALGRKVLIFLLVSVAVFDIAEGALTLTGTCAPPAAYQGTVFTGATIPMLLLAIVVGGASLVAASAVLFRHRWSMFFAAAAGLVMIAWELVDLALAQQFSSIFVVVGLAVIALAEYLGATEAAGQHGPAVRHVGPRLALLVLETFIAVGAIDGGMALLQGAFDQVVSVAWLAGTPFADYTVPARVLVVVVGGSALLAAATSFLQREWAVLVSATSGLIMAGYLVVEAICLDSKVGDVLPIVLAMQTAYFVPGLAIVGLAGFLWTREYRGRRLRTRQARRAGLPANPATATRS